MYKQLHVWYIITVKSLNYGNFQPIIYVLSKKYKCIVHT